ncbi:MAG: MFS transporter, partial [Rhodospirillales bacterium]|nr:MFS transporter [Rhodospirillales bacterium]
MRGLPLLRLLVVGLGTLVVPLDSMVNVAFPAIVGHFAIPIAGIQWVVIGYVLAQSSLLLAFGRVGDMLGYRRIFLLGSAWSGVAFALCALAPSFGWLLLARVLQGIGAGLLLSCGPALATQQFPEAMRARVLGAYTMMFGLGGALGPVVAGVLVARWGWASVYAARVPLSLLPALFVWTWPTGIAWLWLLATGILGTVGQLLWTRALRLGEVSALTPISFTQLPLVVLLV